jgi:glycosyltransferase involved in cell wall biosynthesis
MLSVHDWAGAGYLLIQSLQSVGVDAKLYVSGSNKYKHPRVSLNIDEARRFARTCNIIQYMHSEKVELNIDLSDKKIVVFHGGGKFRNNPENICRIFNPIVDCSIIQTYDLFGLGCKNEKWLLPPIDTKGIRPVYQTEGKNIIVGHYPSSPRGKGSDNVNRLIKKIRNKVPVFDYRYSYNKVPWQKQIKRMSSVDIYVERMSLKQHGKQNKNKWFKTGGWGITALEAASLGKIVVTNFLDHDQYKKEYGKCSLQIANSENDMEKLLIKLLSIPKKDLLKLKQKTRKWAETYHSFEVVGLRLKKIYEEIL